MSLTETLKEMVAQSAKRLPAEAMATMQKATAEFEADGVGISAPKVGGTVPAGAMEISLTDATGQSVTLANLLSNGPLILNFYRGGWCPYCNLELKAYQDLLPDIIAKGATLVAISPEKPDNSLSTAEKNALTFPVLSDTGNALSQALGLVFELSGDLKALYEGFGLDLPGLNAQSGWTLPIPAVFVIDHAGNVLFADVDLNYTRRAEPSDAVAALSLQAA